MIYCRSPGGLPAVWFVCRGRFALSNVRPLFYLLYPRISGGIALFAGKKEILQESCPLFFSLVCKSALAADGRAAPPSGAPALPLWPFRLVIFFGGRNVCNAAGVGSGAVLILLLDSSFPDLPARENAPGVRLLAGL